MKKLTLDEFQSAGYEDWKRLALKELRDQPFDTLTSLLILWCGRMKMVLR